MVWAVSGEHPISSRRIGSSGEVFACSAISEFELEKTAGFGCDERAEQESLEIPRPEPHLIERAAPLSAGCTVPDGQPAEASVIEATEIEASESRATEIEATRSAAQATGSLFVFHASPRDAEAVARVVRKSFREYRRGRRRPLSARLSSDEVRRQLRRGETHYALARLEQEPVGAVCVRKKGRVLVFGPVGVVPAHRAQGVGAALLRWAEEWAEKSGCQELKGEVLWGLDSLVRYYRRRGFEIKRTPRGKTVAAKRLGGFKPASTLD